MTVYIDALMSGDEVTVIHPGAPRCFRKDGACHLWADTLEELHAFAQRLGLKRAWFQNHRALPHYDLTGPRRRRAVALGAEQVSAKEWLRARRSEPSR